MNTTVFLWGIIALAVILTIIGEIWDPDKGKFWNYPFKVTFDNKIAQVVYRAFWVILIIALWLDLAIMLKSTLSGLGWLWMLLIIPASTFGLIIASLIIVIAMVFVTVAIKAILSKLNL